MGQLFCRFPERFLVFVLGRVVFPENWDIRETRGVHLLSARGNFTLPLGAPLGVLPPESCSPQPACSAILSDHCVCVGYLTGSFFLTLTPARW